MKIAVVLFVAVSLNCSGEKETLVYVVDGSCTPDELVLAGEAAGALNDVLETDAVAIHGYGIDYIPGSEKIKCVPDSDGPLGSAQYEGQIKMFRGRLDASSYAWGYDYRDLFRQVAMHELAHAVTGVGHVTKGPNVMSADCPGILPGYSQQDRERIREAYKKDEAEFE